MFTNATNSTSPRVIPLTDLEQGINDQVGALDPQRAQGLGDLATVRTAQAATLARSQKLLTLKLGASDPQVTDVAAQLARNTALQQSLAAETARASTPAPAGGPQSYVFHGFVLDGQQQPLPQLTVALYDAQNQWFRQLGFGCTDPNGYFLLRYDQGQPQPDPVPAPPPTPAPQPSPAPSPAPVPQPVPHPVPVPQPTPVPQPFPKPVPAPAPAPGKKPLPAPAPIVRPLGAAAPISVVTGAVVSADFVNVKGAFALSILVFDQQQNLLDRDPQPLSPQLGQVDYRVIIIGDKLGTCAPPPGTTPPPAPATKPSTGGSAALRKPPARQLPAAPAPTRTASASAPPPAAAHRATAPAGQAPPRVSPPAVKLPHAAPPTTKPAARHHPRPKAPPAKRGPGHLRARAGAKKKKPSK